LEGITAICKVADETAQVTTQLFALLKAHPTAGKQVHDANIVATMLAYDIDTLLTLNIADFKRFESKIKLISPSETN
jgi:predicted nucleic acid-binding protein